MALNLPTELPTLPHCADYGYIYRGLGTSLGFCVCFLTQTIFKQEFQPLQRMSSKKYVLPKKKPTEVTFNPWHSRNTVRHNITLFYFLYLE